MSTKTKNTTAPANETKTEATAPAESVYSREELVKNYKVFNTYREIVAVALALDGKEEYTVAEAKTIIEKFKNKEVK